MKMSKNFIWKAPRPYMDKTYRGYELILSKPYQNSYAQLDVYDALFDSLLLLARLNKYSLVYDDGRFFCDGWEIFLLRKGASNVLVTLSDAPKGYCWPLAYGVPMMDDLLFFAYSQLCDYDNIDVDSSPSFPRASAEVKGEQCYVK